MLKKLFCFVFCLIVLISFYGCKNDNVDTGKLSVYNINATFDDENMTLNSIMDFEYYNNTQKEITELKFNLYGNAFREDAEYKPVSESQQVAAYPKGESYGNIEIHNVKDTENALEYEISGKDENILNVKLNSSIFPSERVEINIEYTLKLANVLHRTGYNDFTVNLANFYPVLCVNTDTGYFECEYYSSGDPFYSECSNYNIDLKIKKSYVVAASVEVKGLVDEGDYNTYHYEIKCVRDFAFVLSKNFSIITKKIGDVTLNYYYYDDENPEKSYNAAKDSLLFFTQKFGDYPYQTLSVCQTGFLYGGMEYPCLTMISDNLCESDNIETIVHENSHQWWYSLVGNNQLSYGWMDEGLAEFSTMMFFENYTDYGISAKKFITEAFTSYKSFYNVEVQLEKSVNTTMNRNLNEFTSELEYINIAYKKSILMFDNLREGIGEKKFLSALNSYVNNYKYKNARPEHLIGCFEKSGANTNEYFAAWIDGKVII